ncbi:sugar transferase [Acidobacteriia bacterium AH_259_A11_L15]|nr:sugar transferase [Acidobacteriia bacterium AH_259_A11_L15]
MKRIFDVLASAVGLLLLSPVLFLSALLIKLEDGGSVFYRGVRVGQYGRPFRIYKFRTMVVNAERLGAPSTADDDPRITKVGKSLRRYKLDELPQLINVLKGEMSLVGPRPEVQQEVALYTEKEKVLLNVRPGMTDYASIQFHNEGEILRGSADPHQAYREKIRPEKIRLGLEYVHNHSLGVDLKLIMQTLKTLFGSRF